MILLLHNGEFFAGLKKTSRRLGVETLAASVPFVSLSVD
jgi:hypothetical protein